MIIPAFNEYAPKADTAGAYLGGVAAAQRDTHEINEVAGRAQQLQLAQQKLQQDAVQNQMEFQARQQQLQQQSMLHEQQLRIDQQYKEQMIGLDQMKLGQAGQKLQFEFAQAARKQQDENEWTSRISSGEDPSTVATEMGPRSHLPSGAFSNILKRPGDDGPGIPGTVTTTQSPSGEDYDVMWNTRNHAQLVPKSNNLGERRLDQQKENADNRQSNIRLNALMKMQEKDEEARDAIILRSNGSKIGKEAESAIQRYESRQKEIDSIMGRTGTKKPESKQPFKEGQIITHKKTGDKYRVTNGRPVLINSGSDDQETSGQDNMGE